MTLCYCWDQKREYGKVNELEVKWKNEGWVRIENRKTVESYVRRLKKNYELDDEINKWNGNMC